MHFDTPTTIPQAGAWYKDLNRYHWFVFIVASLGWLFDTMDQQLFSIARTPAMRALAPDAVATYSGYATSIFLVGWGAGGLLFGVLGDLIGRARSGMTSATRATPTANWPPTPSPVKNR